MRRAQPPVGTGWAQVSQVVFSQLAAAVDSLWPWPGFGQYLVSGLIIGDMNAVLGCTLLIGLLFIGLNLFCDLLYRVFDPRTR